MEEKQQARGTWGSRLGFILAAAGSAIGLGAIWKFPYMAGANGGGAFLLVYLVAVLGIGLAMMLAELAVGRASHSDAVNAFRTLGGKGWSFFGYFSLLAAFIILSFYCVVGGWTVGYLYKSVTGTLLDPGAEGFSGQFSSFVGSPGGSLFWFAVFMLLTVWIILGGVKDGIERASKFLMPLLFLLMLAMIARSVTLPGAMEGIRFFLVPEPEKITPRVLIDALGFACFSLSLGFAGMLTYGSYMKKDEDMVSSALWVVFMQTAFVILAGFMVLPAVFATGMEPGAGPGLTYITLPAVFKAMPGGGFFAAVFFLLLLVAALTSSVSILEPLVAWLIDTRRWRREAACLCVAVASFILGIPATLSFGIGEGWTLFGKTPFDLMDYLTLNIMLPVNVLAACILMGWIANKVFLQELYKRRRDAEGNPAKPWWASMINFCCKYLAPLVIAAILLGSFLQ
ncbi:MAG: sodium-dependent transporter [Betaproteobacteria bacterium]|nr:sodium-dependent transporter [Betaproteobacteria bacterium]